MGRMRPRIAWAQPPMHVGFGAAVAGGVGLMLIEPSGFLIARVVAEALALFFCLRGVQVVAFFATLAVTLVSFTGHASLSAGSVFLDLIHTVSAALWAGGILALASLRPPEGWTSSEARTLVERWERVAVIAFVVTALTGLLRATEQLFDLSDLWTTSYGEVLALKVVGVAAMLGVSVAWRRGRPLPRADAALTILVIALTALLAAFPVQSQG
jgi:putative copper resistance protein D